MERRAFWRAVTTVAALAFFACAAALAQTTGTISGYAHDPSGASIAGVKVSADMVEQNLARTTATDDEGFYNFLAMPPGTYRLTAEKAGFQKLVLSQTILTTGQNVRADFDLKVGTSSQEVTVTGTTPLVDTRSATISGLVDDRRVTDLPLNGRNVIGLAATLPGVLGVKAKQRMDDTRDGPTMDVNGGRDNMNLFTLNAGYFNNPSRNTGMNPPPPDAIQEFRILTNNYPAEYGRNPGSQVTLVTKAGTNSLHGSAWEFLRNDHLDADDFFVNKSSSPKPKEAQNQFGFTLGGPVLRNKVFAFGSFQGLTDRPAAGVKEAFVPSAAHRAGDFSDLLTLTNPTTLVDPSDPNGKPFVDSNGASCVNNNKLNPNCISPVAQSLLPYVPQATNAAGSVFSVGANPKNNRNYLFRTDWIQSSKHTLYGHYFRDHNDSKSPFGGGGNLAGYIGENFTAGVDMGTLNDTYTFSPTLLNQLVVSYSHTASDESETKTIAPSALGMNMPQYVPTGAIDVNVQGFFDLGSGFTTRFLNHNWQLRDSVSWIKGRHTLKFGGEVLRLNFEQIFIGSPGFVFSGKRTNDPVADFLLGAFDSLNLDFGIRDNNDLLTAPSVYFQDEFKVTPRFTLTYGLRYEPFLPWIDKHDRIDTVAPGRQSVKIPDSPPGVLYPGDPGIPRGLVGADLNNFAPRLGFAWDVFGDGKTSLRGAYGMFFESVNADSLAQENPPFAGFGSAFGGRFADPFGSTGQTAPPVSPPGTSFGCSKIAAPPGIACTLFPIPVGGLFTDLSLRTPYIQSWNLGIQRQLTPDVMLEMTYVGKIGTKIEALRTYNPAAFVPGTSFDTTNNVEVANTNTGNINNRVIFEPGILSPQGFLLGNDFRSWYHSLQTQVTKRFSDRFSIVGSYTLAKSLDSSSTDNLGATVSNPFDLRTERGRSDWDRRHAVVVSWLYSPNWQFGTGLAHRLLGGWTFTGIHAFQSGLPITFNSPTDVAIDGTFGTQHAFMIPGQPIARNHSDRNDFINAFFNTATFIDPTCGYDGTAAAGNPTYIETNNCTPDGIKYSLLGRYGNSGRGILSGPAFANTDFSVLKNFSLSERSALQFRTEFFNLFNQANFGLPDSFVGDSTFGQITSTVGNGSYGREIQFALKLTW